MSFLRRHEGQVLPGETSPLVDGAEVFLVETVDSSVVIEQWQRWSGIDASGDLANRTDFNLVRCSATGLEYTRAARETSGAQLFDQLRRVERMVYPVPWEQSWSLRDLAGRRRIMVIENGVDPFLKLARSAGFNAQGTASAAIDAVAAQRQGLAVEHLRPSEACAIYGGTFDAVVAFEYLDRTTHPGLALRELIDLTRIGGEIVLSVNFADSDIDRHQDLILMPPLATSRWSEDTMRHLPSYFPVELEGLAVGQIGEETGGVHRSRFRSQFELTDALTTVFPEASPRALTRLALRRFSEGQRLYVRLRRVEDQTD